MILLMNYRVVGCTVTIITLFYGPGRLQDNTSSKTDEVKRILSTTNRITKMVQINV